MVPDILSQWPPVGPSCSIPFSTASSSATLDTILVYETLMVRLSVAYFDPLGSKTGRFTQMDRFSDRHFFIIHKFSVAMLARQVHLDIHLQLIIP